MDKSVIYTVLHSNNKHTNGGADILTPTLQNTLHNIIIEDNIKPYDMWLSTDPFQKRLTVPTLTHGTHPTMVLLLCQTDHKHWLQLKNIEKGTPEAKISKWRSKLKRAILLNVGGIVITLEADPKQVVAIARANNMGTLHCEFATLQYQP
jgi:hypothetical protein